MTEYQHLINLGVGALLAVLGWFARQLWDAVQKLKDDLSDLREEIAKDYTRRDDFKEFAAEIRNKLDAILEKIDDKVAVSDLPCVNGKNGKNGC